MADVRLDHEKFAKAMERKQLSQEKIAEEIGITDRHIRNLRERDIDVSSSVLYKMGQVFQLPMEDLLVLREEKADD